MGEKILYGGLGFAKLLDWMPKESKVDDRIVQAARVSYGAHTKEKSSKENGNLLKYLYRNNHMSPFEMPIFLFHLRVPIFVMRQLVRHRTAKLNEISLRYTEAKDEFYVPKMRMQGKTKHSVAEETVNEELEKKYNEFFDKAKSLYSDYLELAKLGISYETLRCGLPINLMTELYWEMDLRNLLNFLELRMDNHAQLEIRDLANAIFDLIKPLCPVVCEAFIDRISGVKFTKSQFEKLKMMVKIEVSEADKLVFDSKSEKEEFMLKISQ